MESQSAELGRLVPCGGGDPIPLSKATILIGRRSSCDVVLEFPNVSSHHCQLELQNGYWYIRDLHSRNGIKVNGERIDSRFLHPGDRLSIAKHHFEILYEPSTDAPPPVEEDPFELSLLEKAGLERKRELERRRQLPKAARPLSKQPEKSFSDDENQAMNWLMDDG
jgi:adenylate cyclase